MSMVIIKPGMLSTLQDLGRLGQQHLGVSVAGAMDLRAHQLANLLVGNAPVLATLEITLTGPTIRFTKPYCLALCGGDLSATLNGQPLALNRPIIVRAKDELSFGVRKQLQAEAGMPELEGAVAELAERKRAAETAVTVLRAKVDVAERRGAERRALDDKRRAEEVAYLKHQGKMMDGFLKSLPRAA